MAEPVSAHATETGRRAETGTDIFDELRAACDRYGCGCLTHRAARAISALRAERHRMAQTLDRQSERIATRNQLIEAMWVHMRHHDDCPADGLPDWEQHLCTCGYRELRHQRWVIAHGSRR